MNSIFLWQLRAANSTTQTPRRSLSVPTRTSCFLRSSWTRCENVAFSQVSNLPFVKVWGCRWKTQSRFGTKRGGATVLIKLTWLVLGEDPAARSRRVEQFIAP